MLHAQVIETSRVAPSPVAAAPSIPARFESVAGSQPDHLAVSCDGESWTYAELNRRANRIAHALLERGFDPQLPIAIGLELGALQIATMLGVLKAGAFFVALDTRNPRERNRLILEKAASPLIVTDASARAWLDSVTEQSLERFGLDALDRQLPDSNPGLPVDSRALACLIFTSGSTGRPKGVMHNHETLLHNADRHINEFRITPADRQLLLYSPAVYGGQRDTLNALLSGASLHVYPLLSRGLARLPAWLRDERVSIFCSVATVFRQMLRLIEPGESLPHIRLFKLGGERSYVADIEEFRKRLKSDALVHCGLGCSETGLLRSFFVHPDTPLSGGSMPLGFQLGDLDVRLIDDDGKSADAGEITVFSRYLSPGYWRDPELTARVQKVDPDDPSRRIFRTGDLARRDADGCFWMTGRVDFQVKVNGNRVQLDEVESAVKRLPGIQDGVVVARHDVQRGDSLEACLVAPPGQSRRPDSELRRILAAELPAFMVPTVYRWFDELPQLPNGKIDRRRLTDSAQVSQVLPVGQGNETVTRTEREIIRIWSNVLGRSGVGVEDDFFDLGGESLRGMMMIAVVERELGIQLPLVELLKASTVRSFAAAIDASGQDRRFSVLVPFRTEGRRTPFFCVHGVYGGVLFLKELADRLDPQLPFYALQPPNLDGTRFRFRSFGELAACYIEVMQTVQPEGPYQIGGFSFGGKVAWEMAAQLRSRGETVRRLVIFDSSPPVLEGDRSGRRIELDPETIGHSLRSYRRAARKHGGNPFAGLVAAAAEIKDRVWPAFQHQRLRFADRLAIEDLDVYLMWNHQRLLRRHQAGRWQGDVIVFGSAHRWTRLQDEWTNCVDGHVTMVPVGGDHRGIFNPPNVDVLARELAVFLQQP